MLDSSMSIQKVLDNIKEEDVKNLYFKNGIYREKIVVDKPKVIFIGESSEGVILEWDDASGTIDREDETRTYGTFRSATVTITENAIGFIAKNITFKNSFDYDNSNLKDKQAVALKNDANESTFVDCRFIGNQDTLCANKGKQIYKGGYIEGHVDFIFGGAEAAFNDMIIYSKDRIGDEKGYVFAPSTPENQEFGYIVVNCHFKSSLGNETVYLGRPWHPGKKSGFIPSLIINKCVLGTHIKKYPWAPMSGFLPEDAKFIEYGNKRKQKKK